MISVQEKLQEWVPGFHFNLGFSGGYFLHGNDEEDEGDWELVKNADKFWWFSHMWLHQKAHTRNTLEEMVEDLKKNLEFAKVRGRLNAQTFDQRCCNLLRSKIWRSTPLLQKNYFARTCY